MIKRIVFVFLSIFCFSVYAYSIDAWIRINQLGYLPNAPKKAVFMSESAQSVTQFSIYDALTNKELATLSTAIKWGRFQSFKSTYILDFSSFKLQGAFYIKAGLIYSPTIYINNNIYLGSADFLLNYMREQRCGYNPTLKVSCHQGESYEISEEVKQQEPVSQPATGTRSSRRATPVSSQEPSIRQVDVRGGWHNASDFLQYGSTSATAVYQLLFAYQMNPTAFADKYDAEGNPAKNGIPDILDEAKWGLNWLLKMYPQKDVLYHQISDDRDRLSFHLSAKDMDKNDKLNAARPVFRATGKPQGLFNIKNRSTGIASIAGKYSSAFGLGAELLRKQFPTFADSLNAKAVEAYQYGRKHPGVCQSVPGVMANFIEEDNWADDMELAATQLYRLSYDGEYLKQAADYGRMEPITPWMCSDTARNFQWYPFVNIGHYMLANVENPRYQQEYLQNMLNGIQRVKVRADENPFNMGVPMIWGSNNMVAAFATQCKLYRTITNDTSFVSMETSLVDWLFGCNPWGTSMVIGLPKTGDTPGSPYAYTWRNTTKALAGGLVDGPVSKDAYINLPGMNLQNADGYLRFQTDWAVYHDDPADYSTNEPTIDGTAALTYLLGGKQLEGAPGKTADNNEYKYGGIIRADSTKKQISLVFTGNEFAEGYETISSTLKKLHIRASFFFTGDFYRNKNFAEVIKGLVADNQYVGAHSDKNLLYCSFSNRDSLMVNKEEFLSDLRANYAEMEKFGIDKNQTPFFLPSYEWYNDSISSWCKEVGVTLVNGTPGTYTTGDYTTPDMRDKYFSSNEIYKRILKVESTKGLNGYILQFNIGTDKRRQDKFYKQLYSLLIDLSRLGYDFVDLYKATDTVAPNEIVVTDKKQKRKN